MPITWPLPSCAVPIQCHLVSDLKLLAVVQGQFMVEKGTNKVVVLSGQVSDDLPLEIGVVLKCANDMDLAVLRNVKSNAAFVLTSNNC